MNACLQNLIHSKYFIIKLLSKRSIINESETPITKEFLNLCEKMSISKTSSIEPSYFRYIFCKKHKQFERYTQFDSIEFCRYLLEEISSELNEIKVKTPYRELSTFGKSKMQCFNEFWQLYVSFYGSIINIFTCTCNHETYSFQVIFDFPLLLPAGKDETSIDELLFQYFKKESINFNSRCENCNKITVHDKEIKLSQPPRILILSLQRMDVRTNRKNDCKVKFKEKLSLDYYIDNECQKGQKYIYDLYGVWCHMGTINKGHYYSYIKINDECWYEFNDSQVNKVGTIETNSKYVYGLLYKRTEINQLYKNLYPFSNNKRLSFVQRLDNLSSQKNVNSIIPNNKTNNKVDNFSNYYYNQNKINYRSIDVKEINNINGKNNNNIEEKLNLIISSKIGLNNLGETCYMNHVFKI